MRTYLVTGSASGMGRAVTEKLVAAGNSVIGVDLRDADVIADLSTPAEGAPRPTRCWNAAAVSSTVPCWPQVWGRYRAASD